MALYALPLSITVTTAPAASPEAVPVMVRSCVFSLLLITSSPDTVFTGTASGLAAGAVVTVMLNGKAYSATVDTNGQWTTTVPASEVGQLGEALYTAV